MEAEFAASHAILGTRDLRTQNEDKCKLAAEHERIGFVAGVQLGVQLMLELGKEVSR